MATVAEVSADKSHHLNRLSQWDTRATSLAPLSEKQRECIIELNTQTQRPIPEKVCSFLNSILIQQQH